MICWCQLAGLFPTLSESVPTASLLCLLKPQFGIWCLSAVTETVCHRAVKTNAFREHANLSSKQRDANEHASLLNKCNAPNSSGVTLRGLLGFKENAQEELWGESVQLPALQSKHASTAGDPKAFQISFKLCLTKLCYSKLNVL